MNEQILNKINDIFSKNRNIILIPHSSPDADALGSCLALYHFFKNKNDVNIISPNEYTDILNFLPGSENVIIYDNDKEKSENLFKNADVIFTLDFNSLGRARNLSKLISSSSAKIIMIDHHENPDNYANIMISDSKMSSTCEMVFDFINAIDNKKIDNKINDLTALLKNELKDKISDVIVSDRLTKSPVLLVAEESGMDINMEKLMKMHNQKTPDSKKILEINADHPMIIKMSNNLNEFDHKKISQIILDQANILDGNVLSNPSGYMESLTELFIK